MDWGLILTTSVAVLGTIATIVLSLKLRKSKEPAWAYKTSKIIGIGTNAPQELKLTFDGKSVNEVYRTALMFLNKGNETIRRDDVTQNIAIQFAGAEILREPTIQSVSRKAIEFSAKQVINEAHQHSVMLDFLYLDHNDGAVIEVIHTRSGQIGYVGNIIGARNIIGIGEMEEGYPPSGIKVFGLMIAAIVIVGVSALAIFGVLPFVPKSQPWVEMVFYAVFGMGAGSMVSLIPIVIRYARFKRFPRWAMGI